MRGVLEEGREGEGEGGVMDVTIPLSGQRGAGMVAIVDEHYHDQASQHRWFLSAQGYAIANLLTPAGKRVSVTMHRWLLMPLIGFDVDHINGDRLDNRMVNLRMATRAENLANSRAHKDSLSGIKGVRFHKVRQRWQARICHAGKSRHLGYFDNPQDAARAYSEAAATMFGKFARADYKELPTG